MTSPHNPIDKLTGPFDLLDADTNVTPVLPKNKLDHMIETALTHTQIAAPQAAAKRPATLGWWSGGLATAACLILLLTLFPVETTTKSVQNASIRTTATTADDLSDISEIMFYDSLEGF